MGPRIPPGHGPGGLSPRVQVALAAALFATGGAGIKAVGFGPWQTAAVRAGVALAAMLVIIPESRQWRDWRVALVGCAYALTTVGFVLANKQTTAASAIFLQNTSPVFVLLLAPLLLGERVTRDDLVYMAALAVGMVLFFAGTRAPMATAPRPVLGNILALCTAVTWSVTLIGYRWLAARGLSVGGAAVCGSALAAVGTAALAFPWEPGRPIDWALLAFLGVFQLGVPYLLIVRAVPRLKAIDVSLLLLLEPVLSALIAWAVHGETLAAPGFMGGAVIVGATVVHARRAATGPPLIPVD